MQLWLSIRERFVLCLTAVDQELSFQDKYLFYRFLEDEAEDAPLPTEEEKKESDEELQDTLLLFSQIGPDAHLRMILSKLYVLPQKQQRLLIWVIWEYYVRQRTLGYWKKCIRVIWSVSAPVWLLSYELSHNYNSLKVSKGRLDF